VPGEVGQNKGKQAGNTGQMQQTIVRKKGTVKEKLSTVAPGKQAAWVRIERA